MELNVLYLIFNRPDVQKRSFERIRAAKPRRLFVAADGPRKDRPEEVALCTRARDIIQEIDWDCEVMTLFRDENLGCRRAVSTAVDWFFEHVEMGMILEDDCVPNYSFFEFTRQLLEKYKVDNRIACIAAGNYQQGRNHNGCSYYYSMFSLCWGWATWRRAWENYFRDPDGLKIDSLEGSYFDELSIWQKRHFVKLFDMVKRREVDSWAYIWMYSCWKCGGLTVLPNCNLVQNVGIGADATHTRGRDRKLEIPDNEIVFPLIHPEVVERNSKADDLTMSVYYKINFISSVKRIIYAFLKIMKMVD